MSKHAVDTCYLTFVANSSPAVTPRLRAPLGVSRYKKKLAIGRDILKCVLPIRLNEIKDKIGDSLQLENMIFKTVEQLDL